jgi:hypothetical protein
MAERHLQALVELPHILNLAKQKLGCIHLRIIIFFFMGVHENVQYPLGLVMTLKCCQG